MAHRNQSPDLGVETSGYAASQGGSRDNHVETPNQYVIGSALRTLELLKIFGHRPHRFTIAELQQRTGLEKNQLYRSAKTLEAAGYIAPASDSKFELTGLLHRLSTSVAPSPPLSLPVIAAPFLDELCAQTGESINLFVRHGKYAVCVDRRDAPHLVRLASVLGVTAPLHAGAVPKAMLAFMPSQEQESLLARLADLPAYTEHTVLNPELLRKELTQIRQRGYSISDADYDASARGVGVPILDELGTVVAGISVGGPSFRVGKDALSAFGKLAMQKAQEISLRLGQGA